MRGPCQGPGSIFPNSRINWPGNSAYLYHPPSNEQAKTNATGQQQTVYASMRTMGSKGKGACWLPNVRLQ